MIDLDGRPVAKRIRSSTLEQADAYRSKGTVPTLAIIIATTDGGAWWYVRSIEKAAAACHIEVRIVELAPAASTDTIARSLMALADDVTVHGIILQTPLSPDVDVEQLIALIPPHKDVDGLNPLSAGRLLYGQPAFAPATAEAVMVLLQEYAIDIAGRQAVVVGRSRVVGKPVSTLLLAEHATVTVCHSRSRDLLAHTKQAEILVVAAGKPALLTPEMVSKDVIVIDVGTNVVGDHQLVGDVDPAVAAVVAGLSPVPGGVGPITTALILQHTITAVSGGFAPRI